ncbi:MAG TPA: MFS transporter, partial [Bryobacterales bacterium]|nr:MFS transporter [Bryobacterales bacterium]
MRHVLIAFAVGLGVVNYIDRVAISQAASLIARDLHLSRIQMGAVFSAFTLSYALFEIPTGFLGDRMGPRRVLAALVIWWSLFTAATGRVWGLASLWMARFLVGIGEAGYFPNMTRAFTTWLPQPERVRAQGIMWMSARWGGAFTPGLVFLVLQFVSWRQAFELFGAAGCLAAAWFFLWYRDRPRDKTGLNAAELELIEGARAGARAGGHGPAPWGKLARSGSVWLLCLQYFCASYCWFFYISWLPVYLQEARHLEFGRSAALAGLPLFFGGIGCAFGGFLATRLARRRYDVTKTRRRMAYAGYGGSAAMLLASVGLQDPLWAMVAMGVSSFSSDLTMAGSWGACMDVGGHYAGTLSGAMNMMGNLGGAISPVAISLILRATNNNWALTFY